MKHSQLRRLIVAGTVVLVGLLAIQVYWFARAFDVADREFDHDVQIALKKVGDSVSRTAEVKKLASNFFVVTTNSQLNDGHLDRLVHREFSMRNLGADYELGVYNAFDDTLVYGHYVQSTQHKLMEGDMQADAAGADKNFVVYFPHKITYLAGELNIWIFSTVVLLLMVVFFSYAISSLLRERRFAELKTDFINNMTHEFKTPVTNIRIAGEVLKNRLTDDHDRRYTEILLKENERLSQKIEQILAGASASHLQPDFSPVDIHDLIRNCAEAFQLKVTQRHGFIRLDFNATNTFIRGDQELLTQALNNVIDNAEKFSRDQPMILLRTRDCEEGIEIDVVDHGIGIPSKMKERVFEKFFRVPSGNVHNVKGFGLGLNFVKHVVQSHKGKVALYSELNRGTEVRILLPIAG